MDRDIPSEPREPEIKQESPRADGPARHQDTREQDQDHRKRVNPRPLPDYRLSEAQIGSLTDIGRFRTLSIADLSRERYNGDDGRMRQDIRYLLSQKLVRTRSVWLAKQRDQLEVVTLTRRGKEVVEQSGATGTIYAGFVKPAEMAHDAAIYRMYQAEATRIAKQGGQIRQISLDYELKRRVFSPLAKVKPGTPEYTKRQAEIARRHGLAIVRGHIQLPDLRIEYQTRDGAMEKTDLELATPHYRPGQLAAKSEAGFTFYASGEDHSRLSSVFDDHDITAEILRL